MTGAEGEGPAGDAAGELAPLSDRSEVLLRQVHPEFFPDGQLSSQAFRPGRADQGQLSVDQGSMTTPQESFIRHTERFGLRSVGVWGLSVGEVMDQKLKTVPDAFDGNDAHSFVDFRGLSRGQCEGKSKLLKRHALERGCLYRP